MWAAIIMYSIYVKCILHVSILCTYTLEDVRMNFQYKCLITNRSIYILRDSSFVYKLPQFTHVFNTLIFSESCNEALWSDQNEDSDLSDNSDQQLCLFDK